MQTRRQSVSTTKISVQQDHLIRKTQRSRVTVETSFKTSIKLQTR